MIDELSRLLAVNGYLPHGYCISWSPPLLLTYVVSDLLIFISYFSMPVAIGYFARRRTDFPYQCLLWMSAAFITACGATHLMAAIVLWIPLYGLDALLKAVTAVVSVVTAVMLWPLIPQALKLPSPAQLRRANEELQGEIAERKQAEDALRKSQETLEEMVSQRTAQLAASEEKYRTLIECANDAVFIHEIDVDGSPGRLLEINDLACTRLGYRRQDLLGLSPKELDDPISRGRIPVAMDQLLREGHAVFETAQRAKDGRSIPVEVSARVLELQGTRLLFSLVRDISERKQAEQHLRENETLYRSLVAAMAEGICVQTADGVVVAVNPAAERIQGRSSEQMLGRTGDEIQWEAIQDDGRAFPVELHPATVTLRTGQPQTDVVMGINRPDGARAWISVNSQPLIANGESVPYAVVTTFHDITEKRRNAEELGRYRHRYRQHLIDLVEQRTAELRLSESRYAFLFQNMQEGLAHCRVILRDGVAVDYEYLEVNPAFEKVSGMPVAVGRRMSEIAPDYVRDDPSSLEILDRVVRTGEPAHWERHLAGAREWFSFAAYRPAAGEFILVIEDITERKRAEDEVRKLSLAVAQSPVSIVITDLEGRIEYVNPAFSQVSGYSAAEALGRNPRLLKSNRTPPETYRELWDTLGAGKVWRGEFVNRRKDGETYLEVATISPLRQADGRVSHYVAVKEDITELKRAMAELRSSEDRLQLAKSAAGLGVFDWDIANGTSDWDARTREIRGVGADEPITSAMIIDGVHPDDRPAVQAAIERALDPLGNGEYLAEYRAVNRADGSVHHVAANARAFFEDGQAVRLVGMVRDITEQKRQEEELLERRSAMVMLVTQQVAAHTAAAIAHELNQPLVSISAYSEAALRMLRTGIKNPEKLEHALEGAMAQAQRAGRSLHELLDFLHKGETPTEPVDLNQAVREALAIAAARGYGQFHSAVELEPNLPPVLANRLQVQKVLVNLLHNGIEAMRDGGVPAAAIVVTIRTVAGRNMAQVTVRDSGPGLDAETAHRIFDPFFTTKAEGIGLGLAISRALVEAHGGQLWAELETGPGATFHFTLPFAS